MMSLFARLLIISICFLWIVSSLSSLQHSNNNLSGVELETVKPNFLMIDFFDGKFQDQFEKWYVKQGLFRELFVLIDNSIHYFIFNHEKIGANVIKGKKSTLYYKQDIDFYNQKRQLNKASIKTLEKIKKIQSALLKKNKFLIPVVIPSKSTMNAQDIPDQWKIDKVSKGDSIYFELLSELKNNKIFYVDGRLVLTDLQKKNNFQSFPRFARHWSHLSTCFIWEKIIFQLEVLGFKIVGHNCESHEVGIAPGEDHDLLALANVFDKNIHLDKVPILPQLQLSLPTNKLNKRIDLLIVSTSFGFSIMNEAKRMKIFNSIYLSYYNNTFYNQDRKAIMIKPQSDDWKRIIENSSVIIFDIFETFLPYMHDSFFDQLESAI